jgi:MerR family transcriptional regulator, light-induced transcriptional regulator
MRGDARPRRAALRDTHERALRDLAVRHNDQRATGRLAEMGDPGDSPERPLPAEDDEPPAVWSAGAVARRLGVSPTTLRSWHHRYGLGPQAPRPGTHRRYSEHDVAVLETMARLVGQGIVPAAAAEIARERGAETPETQPAGGLPDRIATQAAHGLVLAALRLDAETLLHTLDGGFATHGLEQTWEELCVPALTALGRRVGPDGGCIDAVLLLSWTITAGLHHASGPTTSTTRARRALLACTDGEQHSLGLEVLRAALAARRVPANMLGASVPSPVITAAAARIRPAAVVVWSQMRRTARPGLLRQLLPLAGTTIAAGPGWDGARLPAAVLRVTSFRDGVDCVLQATVIG